MRKVLYVTLIMVLAVYANAQGSGIGVGLSDAGLEGKYWMSESTALAVHYNLGSSHVSVDYLLNQADMLKLTDAPTPIYYGAGLGIGTSNDENGDSQLDLGIRGVIGIGYYLSAFPVDIYLEAASSFGVLGDSGFGVGGNLGIRYFF